MNDVVCDKCDEVTTDVKTILGFELCDKCRHKLKLVVTKFVFGELKK